MEVFRRATHHCLPPILRPRFCPRVAYYKKVSRWLEHIGNSIRNRELLRDGAPILVGVSGGLDSMVLLRVLHELAPGHRWRLRVAHFNHQLRGKSSDADEDLVRKTAEALKVPFVSGRGDVKGLAKEEGLSVEMAARKLRHDFFARSARGCGSSTVALAHHAGDQVELFFLRLLRGAGSKGLGGMGWKNPSPSNAQIELVRPLLDQSKEDLEGYARDQGIAYSEDATNASLDFQRNRIRHELIPLLEEHYQPALIRTTLRTMELVGAEGEFVTEVAARWLGQKRPMAFTRLALAVQRRCLQLQLLKLKVPADFDLVEQLRQNPEHAVTVDGGRWVLREMGGTVRLVEHSAADFGQQTSELALTPAGQIGFGKLRIAWSIEEKTGLKLDRKANQEYFNADKVGERVWLRHWQPGDRFHPIGAAGLRKLQDVFTDLKVPKVQRHQLVVAVSDAGEIFWVEGLRISERFKLDKQTVRRLKWCWSR